MSIRFAFAASQGRDRVGDFLEVSGIDCTNHRYSPVGFLDHGRWLKWAIGKTESPDGKYTVEIQPEKGLAVCQLYLSQSLPEAKQAYLLYKEGIYRAGSIGYRPLKVRPLKADPRNGIFKPGVFLEKVDLLEVTLCGMPINPDAVRKAIAGTWEGKSLMDCFRASLEPFRPGKSACVRGGWEPHRELVWKQKDAAGPAMSASNQATGGAFVPPPAFGPGIKLKRPRRALMRKRMGMKSVEFDEAKHPRDHGKFASSPGAEGEEETEPAAKKESSTEAKTEHEAALAEHAKDHAEWQERLKDLDRRDGELDLADAWRWDHAGPALESAGEVIGKIHEAASKGDTSPEQAAEAMHAEISKLGEAFAAPEKHLLAAGVEEEELAPYRAAVERLGKKLAAAVDTYTRASTKANEAAQALKEAEASPPEAPELPPEPAEPPGPDYSGVEKPPPYPFAGMKPEEIPDAEYDAWSKLDEAHDAAVEKIDAEHEKKVLRPWQKEHDRWEEKVDRLETQHAAAVEKHAARVEKLTAAAESARESRDDAADTLDGAIGEVGGPHSGDRVWSVLDKIVGKHNGIVARERESEQEDEPKEPEPEVEDSEEEPDTGPHAEIRWKEGKSFNEGDHPRANDGKFGSGGGTATATKKRPRTGDATAKVAREAFGHVSAAGRKAAMRIAHAGASLAKRGYGVAADHLAALTAHVPEGVRAPLGNTYHAVHAVLMAGNKAVQALAKQTAHEKGLSPEHVESLSRTLGAIDLAFQGGAMAGAIAAAGPAPGLALACKAASYVPVASIAWLVGSAIKDRTAVPQIKAACKLLKDRFPDQIRGASEFAWGAIRHPLTVQAHGHEAGHKAMGDSHLEEWSNLIAEGMARASDADAWLALFSVAFDETHDVAEAVRMADE